MTIQEVPFTQQNHPKVPRDLKPGHVFVTLDEEIENYGMEARRYRENPEELEAEFTPFRLRMGTYGQRQMDNQMMRIKLPYGGVNAEQMDVMAEIAEKLLRPPPRPHHDAREHPVPLRRPRGRRPTVMHLLAEVGLTTREACGHTVRNVTGCPYAGISDTRAVRRDAVPRGLRAQHAPQPDLPEPAPQVEDRVLLRPDRLRRHAVPRPRLHRQGHARRDGKEVRGFDDRGRRRHLDDARARRTSSGSSPTADDGEYIRVAEACLKVFDKEGGLPNFLRKNMNKARVKFLLHKLGIEEFRARWTKSWPSRGRWEPLDMAALMQLAPEGPTPGEAPNGVQPGPDFDRWVKTNVEPQRQPGFVAVTVTVPLGNLSPEQFRGVGEHHAASSAAATPARSRTRTWSCAGSTRSRCRALHSELKALGLGDPDAGLLADTVACPGTDSCKMGITSSQGVGCAIREASRSGDTTTTRWCRRSASRPAAARTAAASTTSPRSACRARPSRRTARRSPASTSSSAAADTSAATSSALAWPASPRRETPAAIKKIIEHYVANRERGRGVRRLRRPRRPEELRRDPERVQGSRPRAPGHRHVHGLGQGRALPGRPRRRRVRGLVVGAVAVVSG